MNQVPSERATFDRYARLVRRVLGTPIATVTVVEADRQVYRGAAGLPPDLEEARETPLPYSLCKLVVDDQDPVVVDDLRETPRTREHLAVTELGVVAYAGWPLTDHEGEVVGSVCAMDAEPRAWSDDDIKLLRDVARACSAELSERERRMETAVALRRAEELGERSRLLLALSTALAATHTVADVVSALADVTSTELGSLRVGVWLRDSRTQVDGPERPGAGETIRFHGDDHDRWTAPPGFDEVALSDDNPLAQALADGKPLYFADRESLDLRYPHLGGSPHRAGQGRAFLPLAVAERSYGTLAVLWAEPRAFFPADQVTLEALAGYASLAVQRALLLEDRVEAALTLQRSLLSRPPAVPGLAMAVRYRPAASREQVGGDWYDAFVAPDGDLRLVIGDVAGHDVGAAAAMGQLRSMLRMTVWSSVGAPSRDLELLDGAMHALGVDVIASAALVRVCQAGDDGSRRLTISGAGHPPPLLLEPDGTCRFLYRADADGLLDAEGPMLGADPEATRRDTEVDVQPGTMLLLYTDGLVERRGRDLGLGLDALRDAVATLGPADPEVVADHVLGHLGVDTFSDDTALLVVRLDG